MSGLQFSGNPRNACGLLPVFSRMQTMQNIVKTQARWLLCFLFLWWCTLSAHSN